MRPEARQIVVATDFSPPSAIAVRRAAELARSHRLPLQLLHALEPGDWLQRLGHAAASQFIVEAQRHHALKALEALRAEMAADGAIDIELEVVDGPLHRCLHDRAKRGESELLVIGATGRGSWQRALLGSTADRLLRLGLQPLLLARNPAEHAYGNLALATDFSAASRRAAAFAASLLPAARHFLVHACAAPLADSLAFTGLPDSEREDYRQEQWSAAMRELAEVAGSLAAVSPHLALVPREGVPAKVLAEFVAETPIDVLALGVVPRPAWESNLLGSTALFAIGGLSCDLLLVPGVAGP